MNTETSLVPLVEANPALVLLDPKKFSQFYEEMKRKTDAHVPDVSTPKGRAAIKSLSFEVTRSKTAIDAAGKKLNEEARSQINLVDASRRDIRQQLEALAEQVRKPLTDWEEAEDQRIKYCKDMIVYIEQVGRGFIGGAQQSFGILFHELEEKIIIDASFGEFEGEARKTWAAAMDRLKAAFAAQQKSDAEHEELERLRAEAAERKRLDDERAKAETEKKAAEEAKQRALRDAEAAEARRVAAEAAEQERIAAAAKRAEAEATAAAERRAREASEEQHRRYTAELKAAQDRADEAERLNRAEADRLAREETDRLAEAQRVADETVRRQADQEHRRRVKTTAKAAIMTCGADEETAQKIVLAIIAGEIPAVTIHF